VGDDAEISNMCGVHFFSNSERDRILEKQVMKRKFTQHAMFHGTGAPASCQCLIASMG